MRLKVKLTIQGEVLNGAILQQVRLLLLLHLRPHAGRAASRAGRWEGSHVSR